MTARLTPNRRKLIIFFCIIIVVYLGHENLHPVAVLSFVQVGFKGEVLSSPKLTNLRKKSGAPLLS